MFKCFLWNPDIWLVRWRNSRFIQLFAVTISNYNIFVLFGIIKYLWTGYSGNSKFTVSIDVNYNPHKHNASVAVGTI